MLNDFYEGPVTDVLEEGIKESDLFPFKKVILSKEELEQIKDYILSTEDYVKSLGPDNYSKTASNSLTGGYEYFNYLNSPIGKILKPKLVELFSELGLTYPIAVKCWANAFRKLEGINLHCHSTREYFCGNLFISGNTKPGTTYFYESPTAFAELDIENTPGELSIFSSKVLHGVKPNQTDEVRISMAIDILENTSQEDLTKANDPGVFYIFESEDFE